MSTADTFRAEEISYRRDRLASEFASGRIGQRAHRIPRIRRTNSTFARRYRPAHVHG